MAKKVNHVVVNGETIVDLRNDNVTPEAMVPGTTAHNAAGEQITGTYVPPVTSVNGKTGAVELGKADVGLDNVPNVSTNNQTPTYTAATTLAKLTSGEILSAAMGKIAKAITDLISHIGDKNNPHGVTAAQAGALPLTGGTLTGNLTGKYIAGTWLRTTDASNKSGDIATIDSDGWIYRRTLQEAAEDITRGNPIGPSSIELYPGASAGNGGYIDFHYNDDSADYTSRLIEIPKGVVRYNGYGLLSSAHIVAIYNHNLSFTNGKAEYQNASIKANHPCFVQFRASAVSSDFLDTALAVDSRNDGILTIVAKNGATFSANVNILIISF